MYVLVDLDGTVYLGNKIIPRAVAALELLTAEGFQCIYVTNNSLAPSDTYVRRLREFGVAVDEDQVLTASQALASRLLDVFGVGALIYVVGSEALVDEISDAGMTPIFNYRKAAAVALGWDRAFTYAKLEAICAARWSGIPVYATNPDPTCPLPTGEVPDCGALIAAIETATSQKITEVVGKPSVRMVELALAKYGGAVNECWVVGDRLHTDIQMAIDSNARSALVLTGATSQSDVDKSAIAPTVVSRDLYDAAEFIVAEDARERVTSPRDAQ